ncbi:MAG: hypothetical protein GXP26_10855 [Planctomycetes bacterium]|nr:hypothetical protein [Planctomycetota bacterium]
MYFEIISEIEHVRIVAKGRGVRSRKILSKKYGSGRWRKMKGTAEVRLETGQSRYVEIHWYECHGIGKQDFKIKKFLD